MLTAPFRKAPILSRPLGVESPIPCPNQMPSSVLLSWAVFSQEILFSVPAPYRAGLLRLSSENGPLSWSLLLHKVFSFPPVSPGYTLTTRKARLDTASCILVFFVFPDEDLPSSVEPCFELPIRWLRRSLHTCIVFVCSLRGPWMPG